MELNKTKTAKLIAMALTSAFGLLWAVWVVVIPADLILGKLTDEFQKSGLSLQTDGFAKGIFFTLKCDALTLAGKSKATEFITIDDIRLSLSVPSVFTLKPSVKIDAVLGGGPVTGQASMPLLGGQPSVMLRARDVQLSKLKLDRVLVGLRARGVLEFDLDVVDGHGQAKLKLDGLDFLPYKYIGFVLPLDLLRSGRGMALISPKGMEIKSATLEGDGIYARVSGMIEKGGKIDMKAELMPSAAVEEALPYFMMIKKFRITDGHYSIPIRRAR